MAWYRCGGGGVPSSLKAEMNDVLNKKFGTFLQNYPPEGWPDNVNLLGPLPIKTASGAIASFSDGADDVPLKSGVFGIVPSGGGGTPSTPVPIVGRSGMTISHGGKNLLPLTVYAGGSYNPNVGTEWTLTESATQFTDNHDGSFSVVTTASWQYFTIIIPLVSGLSYTSKITVSSSGNIGTSVVYLDKDMKVLEKYNNTTTPYNVGSSFTASGDRAYYALVISNRGTTTATLTLTEPQIEFGNTATDYEPFVSATHAVSFGSTVYGGEYSMDGGLTVTHDILRMDTFNWVKSSSQSNPNGTYFLASASIPYVGWGSGGRDTALCNALTKASSAGSGTSEANNTFWWNNLSNGIRAVWGSPNGGSSLEDFLAFLTNSNVIICGELATPTETEIEPTPISSRLGSNNIWCDTGDCDVEYYADINLALNQ